MSAVIRHRRGPIAWMATNSVAANLLMAILLLGGLLLVPRIKQEVFPAFDLDMIRITVPYPGASPAEVEQGIVLVIEEAVRGIDGVKRVTGNALEGQGVVTVELLLGANANKSLQDIKNEVDRITSFPQDSERPVVNLLSTRRQVISLVLYGDQEERVLRQLAERVREDLLAKPEITLVELSGVRPLEISIEVPQEVQRAYGITLQDVADRIRSSAIELPGGGIKTTGGEILLRTMERRDYASQFRDIPLLSRPDGTTVHLGDVATLRDGFADTDQEAYFDGRPAAMVDVYRVGDQTPIEISRIVHAYAESLKNSLPEGLSVETWQDRAEIYRDRINLLLRNAKLGLLLVLVVLALFLEVRLAFWVALGIPVSVIGSLLLMPVLGVSFNMISLFGFILTLGIVVDDAIVVGENVYEFRQQGMAPLEAAIEGARSVAVPVVFSVLTNIVAFMPLFFVPGTSGKIFMVIPAIVVPIFAISLIESLFVLPAHLGHQKVLRKGGFWFTIRRFQGLFGKGLQLFVDRIYSPLLHLAMRGRYLTVAIGLAVLILMVGAIAGGRVEYSFMPRVEGDSSTARLTMPYGTPVAQTRKVQRHILDSAMAAIRELGKVEDRRGIFMQIGSFGGGFGPIGGAGVSSGGSHLASVQVYLVQSDQRAFSVEDFTELWRKNVGEIPGIESLTYSFDIGPGAGAGIDIELSHEQLEVLEMAATELAESLRSFAGVKDIDDGFTLGKPQLNFRMTPRAESMGINAAYLGRQIRAAFYGAEAIRQQRGRNEVKVMVRLPEKDRKSEFDLEELLVLLPKGGEVPLSEIAHIDRGRAYTAINRAGGRRVINVTADVVRGVANANKVLAEVRKKILPALLARYPGLVYGLEGKQRDQAESAKSLGLGFAMVLVAIFAMLAIPFKSYVQPLVVMVSIPFGTVGAVAGHLLMGYELSMISIFGIVALAGVVVNDSLVLIDAANHKRLEGCSPWEAIFEAGRRRFRPILLTSWTTFFGLLPMIFETSVQARFLIPMALSLGYGILFATLIALGLVPCLYLIVEDFKAMVGSTSSWDRSEA